MVLAKDHGGPLRNDVDCCEHPRERQRQDCAVPGDATGLDYGAADGHVVREAGRLLMAECNPSANEIRPQFHNYRILENSRRQCYTVDVALLNEYRCFDCQIESHRNLLYVLNFFYPDQLSIARKLIVCYLLNTVVELIIRTNYDF